MKITNLLEKIQQNTDSDTLKVKGLVEALDNRGFGPLLLAPALFVILPTGAIPGVPTIVALLNIFIAGQLLLGFKHPWIPKKLALYEIDKEKFNKAFKKISPYTRKIDCLVKPRLQVLLSPISTRLIAALCIILSFFMIPIGFIPFAVLIPACSIAFLALGISARDGLIVAIGIGFAVVGLPAATYWLV